MFTDEFQAGFLTGNLELLVEPLLARYYQPSSASDFGGSLVLKYNLLSFDRWMPYWAYRRRYALDRPIRSDLRTKYQLQFRSRNRAGCAVLFDEPIGFDIWHALSPYLEFWDWRKEHWTECLFRVPGRLVFLPSIAVFPLQVFWEC